MDLTGADIKGANFEEASIPSLNLTGVKNAPFAKGLETTRFDSANQPRYAELSVRQWPERFCDWETIKSVGRYQLFGVSYTLLIYLVTSFYVIGQYDDKISLARQWAESAQSDGNLATRAFARQILDRAHTFNISWQSIGLLISTLVLVVASVIYTLACPAEVKEFSSAQWRYAYGRSLVHYWPLSWKRRWVRLICATFYTSGGVAFLFFVGLRLIAAVQYAWQYL